MSHSSHSTLESQVDIPYARGKSIQLHWQPRPRSGRVGSDHRNRRPLGLTLALKTSRHIRQLTQGQLLTAHSSARYRKATSLGGINTRITSHVQIISLWFLSKYVTLHCLPGWKRLRHMRVTITQCRLKLATTGTTGTHPMTTATAMTTKVITLVLDRNPNPNPNNYPTNHPNNLMPSDKYPNQSSESIILINHPQKGRKQARPCYDQASGIRHIRHQAYKASGIRHHRSARGDEKRWRSRYARHQLCCVAYLFS